MRRRLIVLCLALLTALAVVPATAAEAAVGDLVLVSRKSGATGAKGDSSSLGATISGDGKKVAFESRSANLDSADTDSSNDVFVRNLSNNKLTLVSRKGKNGVKGNSASEAPSLSADGNRVAFVSYATNLHPDDVDYIGDIFVKDLNTGEIWLASTNASGVKANGKSQLPTLSADGTRVAFESSATNLHPKDQDSISDIFVKDLVTGELWLVSITKGGVKGNKFSYRATISGNGARVVFQTYASNLNAKDKDELIDVYVKDLASGDLILASTNAKGKKGNGHSQLSSISDTGHKVAFGSYASNLHSRDKDTTGDIYVKTLSSGAIVLASSLPNGKKPERSGSAHSPSLSGDGNKVAFYTYTDMVSKDKNFYGDIYVKTLGSGALTLVSVTKSGKQADSVSVDPVISNDGSRVAFISYARNLVGADKTGDTDVYAKHIGPGKALCRGLAATKVGTSNGETINGTGGPDIIQAGGGNDTVNGKGGHDVICGGAGNDKLFGSGGADILSGDGGNDTIDGGDGNDKLHGGDGNDTLKGGGGNDGLFGNGGKDTLNGGPGRDTCNGGAGVDTGSACEVTIGIP